ncbi:MAG TPA: PhoPQ-activated protein PqaA family protein, partial [Fimbriimonadaceae bacterium]|nr:PhoPQ-activated protein PqaA family protein [Fimbriimonadaceae bacterium]
GGKIKRFVVTGASKRGWTTWLAAATGDPRIVGIAPVVYDNLHLRRQMPHQLASWGKYSEMIQDYTDRGLQTAMSTERGQRLTDMVDPYSYLSAIDDPVLIVNGSNDPYWTSDSLSVYWHSIRSRKSALVLPNEGHTFRDERRAYRSTLAAFARSLASGAPWPSISTKWEEDKVQVSSSTPGPEKATLWVAESRTLDFRESNWTAVASAPVSKGLVEFPVSPSQQNRAILVEVEFARDRDHFFLSTPVKVVRRSP